MTCLAPSPPRAVILSNPGAGKTTLTRFLATRLAEACLSNLPRVTVDEDNDYGETRLPILLRVSEYADAFRNNRNLSLRAFLPLPFGNCPAKPLELASLFKDALLNGQAFILLDGLDEVGDGGDRIKIAEQIEAFSCSMGPGCHILVTSRIAGCGEARLTAGFARYTLRDRDREQ